MLNTRKAALWSVLAVAAVCMLCAGCGTGTTEHQPLSDTGMTATALVDQPVPLGDSPFVYAPSEDSIPPMAESGVSVTTYAGGVSAEAPEPPAEADETLWTPPRKQIEREIILRNRDLYAEGELDTASYAVLAEERPDDHTLTLYLMARYASFDREGAYFAEVCGTCVPTALTFRAADPEGPYELTEYWEPADGGEYWSSLRRKFPASVDDDALDTQRYVTPLTRACYAQAVENSDIDTAPIIAELLDAVAEGLVSSSAPGDYAAAHPWEMRQLSYFGDYTLRYVFAQFLAGGQDDLRGHLMRMVMDTIIGGEALTGPDGQTETGQQYFDRWLSAAESDAAAHGAAWMAENRPAGALALEMKQAG